MFRLILVGLLCCTASEASAGGLRLPIREIIQKPKPRNVQAALRHTLALEIEDFPHFRWHELAGNQKLFHANMSGRGYLRLETGEFNGEQLFAKFSSARVPGSREFEPEGFVTNPDVAWGSRTQREFLKEIRMYTFLNCFGFGPKLWGIDEKYGYHMLVRDFVPGRPIRVDDLGAHEIATTVTELQGFDLELLADVFRYAKIEPEDLQLVLTEDGRRAIPFDTEYFTIDSPGWDESFALILAQMVRQQSIWDEPPAPPPPLRPYMQRAKARRQAANQ